MGRPTNGAARLKKFRSLETDAEKILRLTKNARRNKISRSFETPEARKARRDAMVNYARSRLRQEGTVEYEHRLSIIHHRLNAESEEQREHRLNVIHQRLANETSEQRDHRLDVIHQRLSNETSEHREHRLDVIHQRLANETCEQREHRLDVIHQRLANETSEQREHRLDVIHQRLANETSEQREHRLDVIHQRLANESDEQRKHRIGLIHERLANEQPQDRNLRLTASRTRNRDARLNETDEQRSQRLETARAVSQRLRSLGERIFFTSINQFADTPCSVCKKLLYPKQCQSLDTTARADFVPPELVAMKKITVCSRCSTNLRKRKIPSQSYWNNMQVMPLPPELSNLSEVEQRLLSRIVPFMKLLKVQNRFSQSWCKGQVILFAQDVIEVAEQLPLPLTQAGLLIVVETRENVDQHKEFHINIERIKTALQWLLRNNVLYRDVIPNFANITNCDISQIIEVANNDSTNNNQPNTILGNTEAQADQPNSRYVNLNNGVSILRGSFHQGSDRFETDSAGKQCTAIAAVACVGFSETDPIMWTVSDIDYILILGNTFYRQCMLARAEPDAREINTDYLAASELLSQITFHGSTVHLNYGHDSAINGHIIRDQSADGFPNLENGIRMLFTNYQFGILTINQVSVCIAHKDQSYWLLDSHSRGPKGHKGRTAGVACTMRFFEIHQLTMLLCNNLKATTGPEHFLNIYSITPVSFGERIQQMSAESQHITSNVTTPRPSSIDTLPDINQPTDQILPLDIDSESQRMVVKTPAILTPSPIRQASELEEPVNELRASNEESRVIFSTSMLHFVDENVPNLDSVVSTDNRTPNLGAGIRIVDIQRKTAPPLNIERERRMEELCWYFLYPDGKNGFGEHRNIPITALDYFQARILSNESRFQRVDYLFFALSVVEYFRAKASVSVSCRMRQGDNIPQGLVDNMHLTMRNVRGSGSYWKRCCAELIAMVRSLGAPTWFATFSCNDLNWPDMCKALLIADGRPDTNTEDLTFQDRLELVEKYPVVIARQFTLRVNALMSFLKRNPVCFGGPIIDFWYRIEFQNRGSPHLHMLLWCDNVPNFNTNEGLSVIDNVVSCSAEGENSELVKRLQVHKHSATCYKDRNSNFCRFGFPRPTNERTECLGPDEALANNGRFCVLKRNAEEVMINNYNPLLLTLWQANMDIQPCGNVTAVAYYIAKYASKSEPNDCGDVVREAVQKAKRQSSDVWKQLFAVSMAILSQRLISAPEAAYRLCHLPLKMSSRKAVFVNSCRPEQRYRLLRLDCDETSVFNNIFDRYEVRPDELDELSLAEFAVRYENMSGSSWSEDDGDIELREQETNSARYITLQDNTRMRVRSRPAVLRHRYFTLNSDRDGFYYNLIVLHIPFRNERDLMMEDESPEACFLRRQAELRPLNDNVSAEQFAHAEIVIQQALAQAVALNVVSTINDGETRVPIDIYAGDQLDIHNNEDDSEDLNDPMAMPDDVFINGIQSLNLQQKNLMKKVSECVEKDMKNYENYQPLLLFITGGAGSGKSFILKLIVEHIRRCYAPTADSLLKPTFVEVASLTGVAAKQISGRTLHSVFSLPIEKGNIMTYQKMTGERLECERRKWRYIKWLVIDEISMVSYENLRIIHLRLQEFKNNNSLFGGINILLFGDIMQLPPVKGHWCFEQPHWMSAEIHLWHQFSFCELTTNMRQSSDTEFVDLLNNLRFGEITTAQLQILCEKRRVSLTGNFADGAAVRIFPTLKLVDDYNSRMTELISRNSRVYTIHAIDESREAATYGKRPPGNVIPADVNNCGGLLHVLKIAVGSRVMLRRNLSISDGLVNGAMGVVRSIKWPALRRDQLEVGELPEAVFILFDDQTIGSRIKNSEGLVSITPTFATFQANKGYGDVERRMLPLILSWAVTVHKLQGTTLERAVIDLGKKNFAKGQVYVALSRVKTLDGIALSDLEPRKLLTRPHDDKAFTEMLRLRQMQS